MTTYCATIHIDAPARLVFEVLTRPELVKRWQYGKTVLTDWKSGSGIRFHASFEGKILEQWGTIIEVSPNALIKYNLFTPSQGLADKPEHYSTTSYVLKSHGERTEVELIQEDPRINGFAPVSLVPILAALKTVAESLA